MIEFLHFTILRYRKQKKITKQQTSHGIFLNPNAHILCRFIYYKQDDNNIIDTVLSILKD